MRLAKSELLNLDRRAIYPRLSAESRCLLSLHGCNGSLRNALRPQESWQAAKQQKDACMETHTRLSIPRKDMQTHTQAKKTCDTCLRAYIHTYIHTYIHRHLQYIDTRMFCMHTYMLVHTRSSSSCLPACMLRTRDIRKSKALRTPRLLLLGPSSRLQPKPSFPLLVRHSPALLPRQGYGPLLIKDYPCSPRST